MAREFGFEPVTSPPYYFISYNSQDAGRVSAICQELYNRGVPMWYDKGLLVGEKWEKQITLQIKNCHEVILFVTKNLMARDNPYVYTEFTIAQKFKKKIRIVLLDNIRFEDVSDDLKAWFVTIEALHGIYLPYISDPVQIADAIQRALISAKSSQGGIYDEDTKKRFRRKKTVKQALLFSGIAAAVVLTVSLGIWIGKSLKIDSEIEPVNSDVSEIDTSSYPVYSETVESFYSEFADVRKGDRIKFGTYPQGSNGERKSIEWRVLTVQSDRALVVTEKLIDCIPVNETYSSVTWETCTLRTWLNGDFMDDAFSSSEKKVILTVTNANPKNPKYGTDSGDSTQDQIFILSYDEANNYFSSDKDRMAAPTAYTRMKGAYTESDITLSTGETTGIWWLRTSGSDDYCAMRVRISGFINQKGYHVHNYSTCVRPAFWLRIA